MVPALCAGFLFLSGLRLTMHLEHSFHFSVIGHNLTAHKALFLTHLLPRLISPSHILNVECCRRKKEDSELQYGRSIDKL